MSTYVSNNMLNQIFDEFIIQDIQQKVGYINTTSSNDVVDYLIEYVLRHYTVCGDGVTPNIYNFYQKHKKFTRFVLVSISLVHSSNSVKDMIEKYKFNESLKWDIEHIVPQNQKYNKFNVKNSKLKKRIGNLTLLLKNTNVKISNQSFYKKSKGLSNDEKDLEVNRIFHDIKTNVSKKEIIERENYINNCIFEIFFKDNGKLLRQKFKEYFDCNKF